MPKTYTFRAVNLPPDTSWESLVMHLRKYCDETEETKLKLVQVDIVPTLRRPRDQAVTALFGVDKQNLPKFLEKLVQHNPSAVSSAPRPFLMTVNGRDVAIDAHFLGFTQLYSMMDDAVAPEAEYVLN